MTRIVELLRRNRTVVYAYGLVVVLVIVGAITGIQFLDASTISGILVPASFIAFVGIGQTFVILTGGIDLSMPSVITASAVLLTLWAGTDNAKTAWVIPVLLVGAALVGAVNGLIITYAKIAPIITTLGTSYVILGAVYLYTNGGSGGYASSSVVFLASHRYGPVPVLALVWLGILVVGTIALSLTPYGRRLYATGLNRRVAEFAGVNARAVTIVTYMISAAAAALAGIALAGYVGSAYLGLGDPYLFVSVAAVAIGGASILGGTGNVVGTTAGALILTLITAILTTHKLAAGWQEIIDGLVILAAISVSRARIGARRRAE
jgi:ribose transport system permease protein